MADVEARQEQDDTADAGCLDIHGTKSVAVPGASLSHHTVPTSRLPVAHQTDGLGAGPQTRSTPESLEVICGPLLNYKHMSDEHTDNPVWHGSVLIVTTPGQSPAPLRLSNAFGFQRSFEGVKLYEDPKKTFWRFELEVPFEEQETVWTYLIPNMRAARNAPNGDRANLPDPKHFAIPSKHESMRIMFHSCNGFSVGTDEDEWSGPAVWNDVLRFHRQQPFHVMIGGGDQIYNDSVRVTGPLKPWTDIHNLHKRLHFPFDAKMRADCDDFYFDSYARWYSTEPFATANAQIPQIALFDDHDIIDGWGSYSHFLMKCNVFRGIGGVAHKYYLLFQHQTPCPPSTFTTDAPQTVLAQEKTTPADPAQLQDTFVMKTDNDDPGFILGKRPGPYLQERSRSLYCQLGKRIAFVGLDARTERTRHQVTYPDTYDLVFNHTSRQIAASNGTIKHLIVLLGVPIAYPRLQWLENILQSPVIVPIRFLNKRFGVARSLFNKFDGSVDILDDLDDHYTSRRHKKERKELILRLQALGKKHGVRVTILGGDVHLAAVGRFYSNPKLNIAVENDFRYMPNIISSAITNKPPPQAVANLIAKRNKIHHLDSDTDETMLEFFDVDPGAGEEGFAPKTASRNHVTMPSRNYAIITESHPHAVRQANGIPTTDGNVSNGHLSDSHFKRSTNPRRPLHIGEQGSGTQHPAAEAITRSGLAGVDGLDVSIRVEKNRHDREGHTQGYGFSIPGLVTVSSAKH